MSDKSIGHVNILQHKKDVNILILGSYDKKSIDILEKLRKEIIKEGWIKCKLVSDLDYPKKKDDETQDEYIERKSITLMERFDICLFVFNCGVNNDGVGYELKHTCDHLTAKLDTSLVLIDDNCSRVATALIRGKISSLSKQGLLNIRYFANEIQLISFGVSSLISMLIKILPLLKI